MESVADVLTSMIRMKGPDYLKRDPRDIYNMLLKYDVDEQKARLVLFSLLAGAAEKASELGEDDLALYIGRECGLRKKVAEELAALYRDLADFNPKVIRFVPSNETFRQFSDGAWEFNWNSSGVWEKGPLVRNVEVTLSAVINVQKGRESVAFQIASPFLESHPSATPNELCDFFAEKLSDLLADDLQRFVNAAPSPSPRIVETYGEKSGSQLVRKYGRENGLRIHMLSWDSSIG